MPHSSVAPFSFSGRRTCRNDAARRPLFFCPRVLQSGNQRTRDAARARALTVFGSLEIMSSPDFIGDAQGIAWALDGVGAWSSAKQRFSGDRGLRYEASWPRELHVPPLRVDTPLGDGQPARCRRIAELAPDVSTRVERMPFAVICRDVSRCMDRGWIAVIGRAASEDGAAVCRALTILADGSGVLEHRLFAGHGSHQRIEEYFPPG